MKVGLIGAGAIAPAHLHGFIRSRLVKSVVAADPDKDAREQLAAEFGIVKGTCARYQDVLADAAVELVDVCTTPSSWTHCGPASTSSARSLWR
jgi:predicted dehydrogenase